MRRLMKAILTLAALLAAPPATLLAQRPAHAEEIGAVEFVRALYARQVESHNARTPIAGEAFYPLFNRNLRTLMQAPRPGLAREPAGPILNAFFGWGVLPGHPVKLMQVEPVFRGKSGRTVVRADLTMRGAPRQIAVRLLRENGAWKIADISYQRGESLLAYYRRITRL